MANTISAAGIPAATTYPRWRATGGGGWADAPDGRTLERERLETRARTTDATGQLLRCFPRWSRALEQLTFLALERLADNEPLAPNDPDVWRSRDAHAQAVLHRYGKGKVSATRLTSAAIAALIDGQALADRDAGLDWTAVTVPASALDERLQHAHARLPVSLDDPSVWAYHLDQRRALARPLGLEDDRADDLSRWVLAHPDQFDAADLRCWRIGSDTWLSLAGEQLGSVGAVERPVGVFVVRRSGRVTGGSWCRCSRSTRSGWSPSSAAGSSAICAGRCCRSPSARRCWSGSTCTPCMPGRGSAWTRLAASPRSSRAS